MDWAISGGYFFQQANGQGGAGNTGFAILDDAEASFWTEFQSLGGVETVGYPISQRFQWNGFTTQAFQKLVLQWRPEAGAAYPVNMFDELSRTGKDPWLMWTKAVPTSQDWASDQGLAWEDVVENHLSLLEQNPAIKAAYLSIADHVTVFGLPMGYADYGDVAVLRAQRAVFQQWRVEVPWAAIGQVVIANGGDLAKEVGLLPESALTPGTTYVRVWATGTVELIAETGEKERWIDVNLTDKHVRAMLGDEVIYSAPAIIGIVGYDTPVGSYQILRRVANETMDSRTIGIPLEDPWGYYLPNVYFTQYFTWRGHSIHYNYWEPYWKFGVAAGSHGCLGLHYGDAQFFWNYAYIGTRIVVHY